MHRIKSPTLIGLLATMAIANAAIAQPNLARKDAAPATVAAQQMMLSTLPFANRQDFDDAKRGFVGTIVVSCTVSDCLHHVNGTAQITPWLIDYERFNDPKRNRFFASPPEIEHKIG